MSRRQSLRKLGFGFLGVAALAFSSVADAASAISTSKKLRVCFRGGVHSVQMPNGDWHLWVRSDPRDSTEATKIKLLLEVASDSDFVRVLDSVPITANRAKDWISRPVYVPSDPRALLYFRFAAVETKKLNSRTRYGSQYHTSDIGTLKPIIS